MPADIEVLLLRLIGGDATAPGEVLDRSENDRLTGAARGRCTRLRDSPRLPRPASSPARLGTPPPRGIDSSSPSATAHLGDDADLLDALARDHLSDHPDHVLAAWIASQRTGP